MTTLFEKKYEGDIQGSTMLLSNEADFFGVTGIRPRWIEYLYTAEDMEKIQEGIDELENHLSIFKDLIIKYTSAKPIFTKKEMSEYLSVSEYETEKLLESYKKLYLGNQIKNCVKNTGRCYFRVEI
tara:strand:+ start:358 stop:735 length:378 start_codon:yes stop_codon:yes gene_type:complete